MAVRSRPCQKGPNKIRSFKHWYYTRMRLALRCGGLFVSVYSVLSVNECCSTRLLFGPTPVRRRNASWNNEERQEESPVCRGIRGALGRTRTCGLLIRSPILLQVHGQTRRDRGRQASTFIDNVRLLRAQRDRVRYPVKSPYFHRDSGLRAVREKNRKRYHPPWHKLFSWVLRRGS